MKVVDGRYEVLQALGAGSQSTTYIARRMEDDVRCVLKELRFERLSSWKSLELFEREADVLRSLDHPQVPDFIEAFRWNDDGSERFFLVQQLINGGSLGGMLDAGRTLDEDGLRRFATSLLGVLEYLHTLVPPVIHRDIKPANVIYRDGEFVLVDFGGAQVVLADDTGGSTVVGTTGYMPPEQLAGRAQAASDLYALGATMIHLVTSVHPGDLPTERLRIDWRPHVRHELSTDLMAVIDGLTEPVLEDRFTSAAEVQRVLAGSSRLPAAPREEAASIITPVDGQHWRVERHSYGIVFEFGPRISTDPARLVLFLPGIVTGVVGIAMGGVVGVVMVAAAGYAILQAINARDVGAYERLTLYEGGRFLFERQASNRERDSARGVLHRADLAREAITLSTSDRVLTVGEQLKPRVRAWLYAELQAEFDSGRLIAP